MWICDCKDTPQDVPSASEKKSNPKSFTAKIFLAILHILTEIHRYFSGVLLSPRRRQQLLIPFVKSLNINREMIRLPCVAFRSLYYSSESSIHTEYAKSCTEQLTFDTTHMIFLYLCTVSENKMIPLRWPVGQRGNCHGVPDPQGFTVEHW